MQLPEITATDPFLNLADASSMALFFVSTSFSLLLFVFFLIRAIKTKRLYWLYFAILMLSISIGRMFYIVYDFLMPVYGDIVAVDQLFPLKIYKAATTFQFIASSCLVGILTILLFPDENNKLHRIMRIALPIIPLILVVVLNVLPPEYLIDMNYRYYTLTEKYDNLPIVNGQPIEIIPEPTGYFRGYPMGLFVMIYVLMPILNFLVPLLFFYLGKITFGAIKKSSYLNGLGFLIYYTGRTIQPIVKMVNAPAMVAGILPPIVILLGLAVLTLANAVETMGKK